MTIRQPKCGTDARCEGYWTDRGYPEDEVPELVSGDSLIFQFIPALMVRGLLITLEGIDGSGKSTVLEIISRRLTDLTPERHLVITAEPTKGRVGEILRTCLTEPSHAQGAQISEARRMEELFLFMADHADHLANKVIPSLDKGHTVISDRYSDSTVAYQGVTLKGLVPKPVDWIRSLHRPWNVVPDLTLLFSLDPALALKRIGSRQGGKEKFEKEDFLKEVDANFRSLARLEPERFRVIDASRRIEDIAEEASSAILDLLAIDR